MHHGISENSNDSAVVPLRTRFLPDVVAAPVDLDDLNSPHTLAVLSVPPGASVLDIGCGPGVVARALAARGCKVWGVEADPRKAASARHFCVEVLEGDVEQASLSSAFGGASFDAILCLDVLEHLRDPEATLVNAAAALAPGGSLLLSLPNVTHGALRLELLSGKFRYRDNGLLDRGHLRFFDPSSVAELIQHAGLRPETMVRITRGLDQTEFDVDLTKVPDTLRTTLESDADALTYQFFIIAKPARPAHWVNTGPSLVERQRARIDELAAEINRGAAYTRSLESEIAAKDARMRELDGTLAHAAHADDTRARLAEESAAYARHLEAEIAAKDARLRELEGASRLAAEARAEATRLEAQIAAKNALVRELEESIERVARADDARARLAEEGAAYARNLEAELAAKDARLRELEGTLQRTSLDFEVRASRLAEEAAAEARRLEAEIAAKDARTRELEGTIEQASCDFEARASRLAEEAAAEARRLEAEIAAANRRTRELEGTIEHASRECDASTARLAQLEKTLADLTRLHEDDRAYLQHLEDELQRRAATLAVQDDELNVLRTRMEMATRTIAERDTELQLSNAALLEREAALETAMKTLTENRVLTAHLHQVLHQPRHRLAETCNHSLKHWMPRLHRFLRPFCLARLDDSSHPAELPGQSR